MYSHTWLGIVYFDIINKEQNFMKSRKVLPKLEWIATLNFFHLSPINLGKTTSCFVTDTDDINYCVKFEDEESKARS